MWLCAFLQQEDNDSRESLDEAISTPVSAPVPTPFKATATASDAADKLRAGSTVVKPPIRPSKNTTTNGFTRADFLKTQATFNETPTSARSNLFIHKLKLCTVRFDWNDESSAKDNRAKEVKRQLLLELVDYIGKNKNIYTEQVLTELLNMVSANLFRALPPKQENEDGGGGDEGGGTF